MEKNCQAIRPDPNGAISPGLGGTFKGLERYRVLVCDDEPSVASELTEFLCELGLDARGYTSGAALLAELRGTSGPVCLITDVRMPGFDGIELVKYFRWRSELHPTAIIVITGHLSEPQSATEEVVFRDIPVLQKPVSLQVLCALLRENSVLES